MRYYCSNTGQGISTDKNIPGDFISTVEKLSPGDFVLVYPGKYMFNKTINIKCNNIKILGFIEYSTVNENQEPIYSNKIITVFNFINIPYICHNYDNKNTMYYCKNGNGLNIRGNNVYIKNIAIEYAPFRGLQNYGNNNCFNHIETSYNCDCGHSQKGENNLIVNCVSHHNFDYRFIKNGEEKFGFNSDGFADKMHKGHGNTYINCYSYLNGDDGFDFFQRENEGLNITIVKNCTAFNNGFKSIDMSKNKRLLKDEEFNNRFELNNYPNYGNGNGFKLGGVHKKESDNYCNMHNITLINCNAISNNYSGFMGNHNNGIMNLIQCKAINNLVSKNFNFTSGILYMTDCFCFPKTLNNMCEAKNGISGISNCLS